MNLFRQAVKAAIPALVPPDLILVRGPDRLRAADFKTSPASRPLQVALTFDDGPHPEYTPRLLDYLAACGMTATFFVVGERAQRYPQIVRRIADEGHELGNHTFTHSEPSKTPARHFLDEVRRTKSLLEDLTGVECSFMRPPKGKLTLRKLWGLWQQRQTVVLWNVDPRDYLMRSRREMERWCQFYQPVDGDIMLMHDNHTHAGHAVETFAKQTRFHDIRFVRISNLLTNMRTSTAR